MRAMTWASDHLGKRQAACIGCMPGQASWTGLQPLLTDSSTASTTLLVMAASLGHHSSGLPPALMALMHFPKASHISVS